ncbi:hypothetical protein C8R47DRAFT_1226062 [Mycena vitilis]|nr:hypothetical protein C8R47DRAFT_1226062 [Mycena vitilis]
MASTQQATLAIEFVVVGGSIAGLATGYCLRKAGHKITILEQSNTNAEKAGSIRSPPNMTRILKGWPGVESLLSTATKCSGISFRRAENSERVGFMKMHKEIMSDLEADFLIFQYQDLFRYLTSLCTTAGVDIKYESEVVGIVSLNGGATVSFRDGTTFSGDIIIGADGHTSLVREILAGDVKEELNMIDAVTGINLSIPTKLLKEHEDLASLCNNNETTLWMGNGSSLVGTLDLNAETCYFSICSPTRLDVDINEWYASSPATKILPFDLSGYDPRLQKLIGLGSVCCPTLQQTFDLDEVVGLDETTTLTSELRSTAVIIHQWRGCGYPGQPILTPAFKNNGDAKGRI